MTFLTMITQEKLKPKTDTTLRRRNLKTQLALAYRPQKSVAHFRKPSSNRRNLKTPALRFSV